MAAEPRPEAASVRLERALREAHAPDWLRRAARRGDFDDFKSDQYAQPIVVFAQHAVNAGLPDLAQRAKDGEFNSAHWEVEAWTRSPDGQEALRDRDALELVARVKADPDYRVEMESFELELLTKRVLAASSAGDDTGPT